MAHRWEILILTTYLVSLKVFFGGRGNPFGGGSRNRRKRTVVGSSIHLQVRITPDEVLRGSSRDLSIDRSISCFNCLGRGYVSQSDVSKCSECNGSGNVKFNAGFVALTTTCNRCGGAGFTIKSPCENCHGAGIESKKDTLNVSIPKGVRESDKIRIPRFGNEEPGCEEPGDVFVSVTIDKDEKFNICGCDVESIVTIKYTDAVLGGDVRIQLIDEIAELEIPSGTSAGERFIFKGKGMPVAINNDLRGDHIIRVDIEIPKKINDEQRKAVSTLKDLDL